MDHEDIKDGKVLINGDDLHHIINVLRMQVGQQLNICDKKGNEYIAEIAQINKEQIVCCIKDKVSIDIEPKLKISLFQAIPKSAKMDYIIQKSVEIGVNRIIPIMTKRTIVKLDRNNAKRKVERWKKISENACKQSGRTIIPQIDFPINYNEALFQSKENDLNIIPFVGEQKKSLKSVINDNIDKIISVGIFIGPEGGFDRQEIDAAVSREIIPITLGPRILRTETAGIVVASIFLYEFGDIGG